MLGGQTLLPVSAVVVLAGGIFWLSSMYALAAENADKLRHLKVEVASIEADWMFFRQRVTDKIDVHSDRLARIEEKLDSILQRLDRQANRK